MSKQTRTLQVLVVDDEPAIRQILSSVIAKAGHLVSVAKDGQTALNRLGKGDIDVAICDIRMPDLSGIEVIKTAREAGIETTFLVMTAYASVDTAIEAMRAGAFDYMLKPLRNDELINRLEKLGDLIGLRSENQVLRQILLGQGDNQCQMASKAMVEIERLISKVAPTSSTVLITGPSGVGKGVIASCIHQNSPRVEGPFIPVNCGAIPENLIESEFFGHTKGAFTGADKAKRGLFVEADQGTIFLDEVGELPLNLQVKLLHIIEDQSVRAVGSTQTRSIDVRILAATNRNIEKMVSEGSFREDLYFRINVFRIDLPALRQRPEDVDRLIDFYIAKESRKLGLRVPAPMDVDARLALSEYEWPGNLRELQNVIARALIVREDERIRIRDLPQEISRQQGASDRSRMFRQGTLRGQLRAFELVAIKRAIEANGGDRKKAAKTLGIGLSSLYRKMEEDSEEVETDRV